MVGNHTKYIQLYKIVHILKLTLSKEIICTEKCCQKKNITLIKSFLHCMFERSLGVKYMHKIEIAYVNKNNAESNIHDKKGLYKNANISRNIIIKISK